LFCACGAMDVNAQQTMAVVISEFQDARMCDGFFAGGCLRDTILDVEDSEEEAEQDDDEDMLFFDDVVGDKRPEEDSSGRTSHLLPPIAAVAPIQPRGRKRPRLPAAEAGWTPEIALHLSASSSASALSDEDTNDNFHKQGPRRLRPPACAPDCLPTHAPTITGAAASAPPSVAVAPPQRQGRLRAPPPGRSGSSSAPSWRSLTTALAGISRMRVCYEDVLGQPGGTTSAKVEAANAASRTRPASSSGASGDKGGASSKNALRREVVIVDDGDDETKAREEVRLPSEQEGAAKEGESEAQKATRLASSPPPPPPLPEDVGPALWDSLSCAEVCSEVVRKLYKLARAAYKSAVSSAAKADAAAAGALKCDALTFTDEFLEAWAADILCRFKMSAAAQPLSGSDAVTPELLARVTNEVRYRSSHGSRDSNTDVDSSASRGAEACCIEVSRSPSPQTSHEEEQSAGKPRRMAQPRVGPVAKRMLNHALRHAALFSKLRSGMREEEVDKDALALLMDIAEQAHSVEASFAPDDDLSMPWFSTWNDSLDEEFLPDEFSFCAAEASFEGEVCGEPQEYHEEVAAEPVGQDESEGLVDAVAVTDPYL